VILGGGVAAGCLFTFVIASCGDVCDCIAFLLAMLPYNQWSMSRCFTGLSPISSVGRSVCLLVFMSGKCTVERWLIASRCRLRW